MRWLELLITALWFTLILWVIAIILDPRDPRAPGE